VGIYLGMGTPKHACEWIRSPGGKTTGRGRSGDERNRRTATSDILLHCSNSLTVIYTHCHVILWTMIRNASASSKTVELLPMWKVVNQSLAVRRVQIHPRIGPKMVVNIPVLLLAGCLKDAMEYTRDENIWC